MCKINKPIINIEATAAKIKEFRIRAGYSVREIQSIFNFSSPEAIYAWEKGKYLPTIDNMIVIANVYGVSVDEFIVRDFVEVVCELSEPKSA
ncbi:MAG: helix-turn-helix transcriptional regulator [Treponema sp.]|jgi:transcriptional regulator with XRE-family HTH domain|nr:helix-turn-helix transcriptional regulator [Treponema sp.]